MIYTTEQKIQDIKKTEAIFNKLYDEFYTHTILNNNVRTNTLEEQYKGIDVKFNINGRIITCDEKISDRYIGTELNTFALELSFISNGGNGYRTTGWFMDEKHINEYLMLYWISIAHNIPPQSLKDVGYMQCGLIKVENIRKYLEAYGFNKDRLLEINNEMSKLDYLSSSNRNNLYRGKSKYDDSEIDLRVMGSYKINEKPINILLKKEEYKDIASCWYVYKDGEFTEKIERIFTHT